MICVPAAAEKNIKNAMDKTHNKAIPLDELLAQHQRSFDTLAELLVAENAHTNLTRITEPLQIHARHFLDSLAAVAAIDTVSQNKSGLSIVDIGSGAGFPVLPLAIVRPAWHFTSIEATGKKVQFQNKAIAELGLKNVTVLHCRAEEAAHQKQYREHFDVALARAVASLRILAELSLGLVKIGGTMFAWKGPDCDAEIQEMEKSLSFLGGKRSTTYPYTLPDISDSFHLITVKKTAPTPASYPREYSVICKK
jgi:16S rRNA (guanine527-N7)-methyltransferase